MFKDIIDAFSRFIEHQWQPSDEQISQLNELIKFALKNKFDIVDKYEEVFLFSACEKLDLNRKCYQTILNTAFEENIKFNHLHKQAILEYLNRNDINQYENFLKDIDLYADSLLKVFAPATPEEIYKSLKVISVQDIRFEEIVSSIFAKYCFELFPNTCTGLFFSKENFYDDSYLKFVEKKYPGITARDYALCYVDIDQELFNINYESGCDKVLNIIKSAYVELNNHSNLIVCVPPLNIAGENVQWKLYSDVVLFAEKHFEDKIKNSYFKHRKIQEETYAYINQINLDSADFESAAQGFVFKDCFIAKQACHSGYFLLIVFEKNIRDERPLFCPACKSIDVQGNSYPILNVRSWECKNSLCPDRSKYNRGKRFSFISVMRQAKMADRRNKIPTELIQKWHLDCLEIRNKDEFLELAFLHYSYYGDRVRIYLQEPKTIKNCYGRHVETFLFPENEERILSHFKEGSYFCRYLYDNPNKVSRDIEKVINHKKLTLFKGDALDVLKKHVTDDSIDAAITSPPYYNAKEYSKWPNIYCYLYDMRNIVKEVFRVLKQGGVFLYNIFDYFDNENNVSLSAMGNKRMILGAYTIDFFIRIGFKLQGNIVWYKGEIQGNRNFNQGNETPYYQAPLNCWEHIFIFSKGFMNKKFKTLESDVFKIRPVVKMVKGKNILGHVAPFPRDIPNILLSLMDSDDVVLDPFSGSMTTGICAFKKGIKSINIEKDEHYCILSDKIFNRESIIKKYNQMHLFDEILHF